MRALYQMHANGNGWGDIGYHYVVGDDGRSSRGKAGGDYVAGGHVYCGNLGTVGISLMGNFDVEKPTQAQMRSLQWLLITLGKRYKIDPMERPCSTARKSRRFWGTAIFFPRIAPDSTWRRH